MLKLCILCNCVTVNFSLLEWCYVLIVKRTCYAIYILLQLNRFSNIYLTADSDQHIYNISRQPSITKHVLKCSFITNNLRGKYLVNIKINWMNYVFISLHLTDENDTDTVFNILRCVCVCPGKWTIVQAFISILTVSMWDSKTVVLMSKSDT